MNKKLILILTEQRTGFHLLNEALNFYSSIQPINEFFLSYTAYKDAVQVPYEIFLNKNQRSQLFDFLNVAQGSFNELIQQINSNPINSLIKLYEISDTSLAVKIQRHIDDHVQLDQLTELLQLPYVEIIILQRSNRIARHASLLKSLQTNIWHGADTSKLTVVIDEEEFIKEEQRSISWFDKVKKLCSHKDYLEVNYEQDLENINNDHFYNLFDPWFEKINLPVTKTNYKLKYFKKQNKSKIQHTVLNYNEIKHLLE